MVNRVVLNETSYFGRGSRKKLKDELEFLKLKKVSRGLTQYEAKLHDDIKAYLNNDKAYIKNKVNLLVDDNNYCETEVELLVLFYSLMENYLKEAKKTIQKIELTSNTLLEEELHIGYCKRCR